MYKYLQLFIEDFEDINKYGLWQEGYFTSVCRDT